MIIQADMPLRGTLRQVYIDRASGWVARITGKLPYGTKLVMRDYVGVPDGKGGWKTEDKRLVPGNPTTVLVQQKERGWGASHPRMSASASGSSAQHADRKADQRRFREGMHALPQAGRGDRLQLPRYQLLCRFCVEPASPLVRARIASKNIYGTCLRWRLAPIYCQKRKVGL